MKRKRGENMTETEKKEPEYFQIELEKLNQFIKDIQLQYPKEAMEHCQYVESEGWLTFYWWYVKFLRLVTPQPRNFDALDNQVASHLKAKGCSMQQIAFVLSRSKSSVCEYLNQK
jgi:hypothetical protein